MGCRQSKERGIGFLEGHGELDGASAFHGFKDAVEREFRSRMDQWLDGKNGPKKYFHNFKSDPDHRNCFVFKYREHRVYGFLCHPNDRNRRFQLCALCIYATKHEHETDRAQVDRVEQWFRNIGAQQAIAIAYPKTARKNGKKQWTN
jgi:hypothetical protein